MTFDVRVAIIPAFDEARTIGSTVLGAMPHVDRVIVVDDGSRDSTGRIAERAGAEVLTHDENRGKGAALRTGIRSGFDAEADVLVFLDADGQHDAERIPDLVSPIEQGQADLVLGSRTRVGDGRPPHHRRYGRAVLDWTTNRFTGADLSDTQTGFRAAESHFLRRILPDDPGFGFEAAMLRNARRADGRLAEVDVRDNYPPEAVPSRHPIYHAVSVVGSLLRAVRRDHPLLILGSVGVASLGLGMYLGFDTAANYYATGVFWPGRAMLSVLFSIVGVQLLMGAMILDVLALRTATE